MEKRLPFYEVDGKYGWDQDDFPGFLMKMGGCAAVTACDSCIYFDRYLGTKGLYPYDPGKILRGDYLSFAREMETYLHPRLGGINTPERYIEGFDGFLKTRNCSRLIMEPFSGAQSIKKAQEAIKKQIDQGYLIPYLLLMHRDKKFRDYNWHWFTLAGYREEADGSFFAEAVSYGKTLWMKLTDLWDTGHENKGGMILFSLTL